MVRGFFSSFFFNSGEGAAGGRTLLRGERSSCGAQMLNKRNRGAARAIKHPPRVLFTGQTGITAPPPPPPPPANPGLTTLSHTCRQKVLATPPKKKKKIRVPPHQLPLSHILHESGPITAYK